MSDTDTTGEAAEQLAPPDLAKRRRLGRGLVVFAAAIALFVSGWGMWHFFDDLPGVDDWYMIVPMFLLFDVAGIASAVNARINRLAYGRMGIEGWLVWLFAGLSGAMSASDAEGRAAAVRFSAPLVAAILFELLIRGERKDAQGVTDGPMARLKRRFLARVGLLDSIGQSDEDAAKRAASGRLATLAYRMHQLPVGTRGRRRAEAKFQRKLRGATERLQLASDEDTISNVRLHLAAMYQAVVGTAPDAVADLNLWQAANIRPAGHTGQVESGHMTGQASIMPTPEQAGTRAHQPAGPTGTEPVILPDPLPVEPIRVPGQIGERDGAELIGHTVEAGVGHGDTGHTGLADRDDAAGKLSREEALAKFGDQLVDEWLSAVAAGKNGVTEYRVRTVCGLAQRPGAWVHGQVRERAEAALRERESKVNGHQLSPELAASGERA
jgi:hypothetical protein